MDRQEAVQKLVTAGRLSIAHAEDLYDSFFPRPVVQQCVADWYEGHKEELNESIWEYLVNWDEQENDDFKRWMFNAYKNGAITTLVNMHQFGYTVEKEAKYTVKHLGLAPSRNYLNCNTKHDDWFLSNDEEISTIRTDHTRKELEEAGFGWVFDCPGVEVTEVTDGND